jgi:hypothetical protein
MVHSFHQLELEMARKLFTFRMPCGLYIFKRMVMGNSLSSSEAHMRVRKMIKGCKGVIQIKMTSWSMESDTPMMKTLKRC